MSPLRLLLLLICSVVVYSAPNPASKHEPPAEKWLRMDVNRDNELTLDEFLHFDVAYEHAKREEFESIDVNNDNQIEKKEYDDHFHHHEKKADNPRSQYFGKIFEDFDDNIDLALNEEELRRLLADRFLVRPRPDFPQVFASFDRDRSGGLDLFEFMKFEENFPFLQAEPMNGIAATQAAIAAAAMAKGGPAPTAMNG